MPNITGLTRAQTRFLRKLRKSDGSFPAADWRSPLMMRRWLEDSRFHELLTELLDAINFQADLHLARASARAANDIPAASPDPDPRLLLSTIRLSHYHRNSVRKYRREPRPFPYVDPEAFARLANAQGD
jgi:hypothetical protein